VRKRRDIAFGWMFWLFSFFIFACGTTHLMAIWTFWRPVYVLDGGIKLLTAAVSVATAVMPGLGNHVHGLSRVSLLGSITDACEAAYPTSALGWLG
jgi:hypothetical protein